jgi:hypothetical protein
VAVGVHGYVIPEGRADRRHVLTVIGDAIVVIAENENTAATFGANPTNTGTATITWTAAGAGITAGSFGRIQGWTGSVTGAGTVAVNLTTAGTGHAGIIVWAFNSHGGVGAIPAATSGTGAQPTLTATWAANSCVCCGISDFSAGIAVHTYRTNIGAATEDNAAQDDGNYTTYAWRHADSGTGGSAAIGMTTSMTYSLIGVEILGTAGSAVTVPSPARGPLSL